jgi:hypothetical protein
MRIAESALVTKTGISGPNDQKCNTQADIRNTLPPNEKLYLLRVFSCHQPVITQVSGERYLECGSNQARFRAEAPRWWIASRGGSRS